MSVHLHVCVPISQMHAVQGSMGRIFLRKAACPEGRAASGLNAASLREQAKP